MHASTGNDKSSVIHSGGVRTLVLLLAAMGTIVGTVDVVSVAFAEQQGQPAAASFVRSVYAIGSCAAGLLFGAVKLQVPLPRLFLLGGLATAATTLPLLMATNMLGLSLAVLVAGLFFAPTMVVAMALVEQLVPNSKLTEGLTWLITGLSIGVAAGAAAAGQVVDAYGPRSGLAVALSAGVVVFIVALLGHRRVHPNSSSPPDVRGEGFGPRCVDPA